MKTILILSASNLPIPAYKGGATETLITDLLNSKLLSESTKYRFEVYSHCNGESFSKDNVSYNFIEPNTFEKMYLLFFRILRICAFKKTNIPDSFPLRLNHIIDFSKYDAVVLEGNKNQVINLRKIYNGRIVLHIHTVITFTKDTPSSKKIYDKCNCIIANSHYCKSIMQKIDPDVDKIVTLPNCVNNQLFFPQPISYRKEMRSLYKIDKDDFVFLYCGRLEPGKGVLELIKAFNSLSFKKKLIIVGSSWFSTNKKTKYIKKLIQESLISKEHILFTGYIEHVNLPKFYSMADVVVMPSVYQEAAGLVAIEAQMCGIPTIISNIGGIPEFTSPCSKLKVDVDSSFVDNLAKKMSVIYADKKLYDYEREIALECVERFTTERYSEQFLKILDEIVTEEE